MKKSLCGIDCDACPSSSECAGCVETKGRPFGGDCVVAKCMENKKNKACNGCNLREQIMEEFNELKIKGMPKLTKLNSLHGAYVNVEYPLSNGKTVKLLDDDKIYLGNQLHKKNSDRCYGVVADENILLVCEYGENGIEPEIILYKKRRCDKK